MIFGNTMTLANKLVPINDNLDTKEEKLRALYETQKDEWPDNALEGGVFQIYKRRFELDKSLTKTKKPHIIKT